MGHTLDELLDATGISDLEPAAMSKTAKDESADDEEQFLKLAERCERAAGEGAAGEGATAGGEKDRELAEKTAAIAIIVRTLGEIEAVSGPGGAGAEKVASDQRQAAAFIERAIAAGHAPDEIARFMKQAGLLESLGGALERGGTRVRGALERSSARAPSREQMRAVGIPVATGLLGLAAGRALAPLGQRPTKKRTDEP